MSGGLCTDLDLLALKLPLTILALELFLPFVAEFIEVNNFGYRRLGALVNKNQIQSFFLGEGEGFLARQNTDVLPGTAYHPKLGVVNLIVYFDVVLDIRK